MVEIEPPTDVPPDGGEGSSSSDGDCEEDNSSPAAPPPSREAVLLNAELVQSNSAAGTYPDWLAPVVATATLLPFLQAVANQAGCGAYEAARALIKRASRPSTTSSDAPQLVVTDVGGERRFVAPIYLSDAALEALARADLNQLAAPDADGGEVTIWWDAASGEWRRQIH